MPKPDGHHPFTPGDGGRADERVRTADPFIKTGLDGARGGPLGASHRVDCSSAV